MCLLLSVRHARQACLSCFIVASLCLQIHPNSINLLEDADGLLPEWVVYHEFVRTSRSFLSTVCPVEHEWVAPLLPRLRDVDVGKLSGGSLGESMPWLVERELQMGPCFCQSTLTT